MKKELLAGGLLALVLACAATWLLLRQEAVLASTRQVQELAMAAQELESRFFTRHRRELEWLVSQDLVRDFLAGKKPDSATLTGLLRSTEGLLHLEVVYLVSPQGLISAASEPGYVGADLAFRPYVQQGLQGVPSYSLAVGVVTKTRGLYAAVPVRAGNQIVGVAAFRTNAKQLDQFLTESDGLSLVGPDPAFGVSPPGSPDPGQIDTNAFRVARLPLDLIPGYTLVSQTPRTFPNLGVIVLVDLFIVLAAITMVLVVRQFRLFRERRAEARGRQARESLLAHLLEGVAVLDRGGEVLWSNPAFGRLVQNGPGEPFPRLSDLWDAPSESPWDEVVEGRRSWVVFEGVLKGRQGAWTPVLAGLTAFEDQFLLSVLDRSERYRDDQLLRQTQKLTVLGQLSGGVAHDLNNMLGVLMGMADLLKMTLSDRDPLQESVDLMLTTLTRAAALAEKMLNFARQTPMARDPLDVTALLRELKFLARTALPERIEAHFEAPETPVVVHGDENLLLSALLNLVLNAAESMPEGGTVRVIARVSADGRFEVSVEDDGRGMAPSVLERIFEPFFSTKLGQKGTGLGLSLVRRTILEHQGEIDVTSSPGVGTRVLVRLPVVG
jgi:C4-dicarboxylate-specific signal transduction histidine kinase